MHQALVHIEKTLADSYRKEIDQEENVWRTMPFFATAISLQLAALGQLVTRLPPLNRFAGDFAVAFLSITILIMLAGIGFLVSCLSTEKFIYLAEDTALFRYTESLVQAEKLERDNGTNEFDAEDTLRKELARQYSLASDNNRKINKRREFRRAIAGLAFISSMVFIILLMASVTVYDYMSSHAVSSQQGEGKNGSIRNAPGIGSCPGTGTLVLPGPAVTTADARCNQGHLANPRAA